MTPIPTELLILNADSKQFLVGVSELSIKGHSVETEVSLISDRTSEVATFKLKETTCSGSNEKWSTMIYVPTPAASNKFPGLKGYKLIISNE